MEPKIDVVLSPNLLELYDLSGKIVVVIDVLRATSTMCAAMSNGVRHIKPVATVEEALKHQGGDWLVAGERNGEKVTGFDFGNSPAEYTKDVVDRKQLVLTTTNGTKCILASTQADEVLIGSFFNYSKLGEYLKSSAKDVILLCAGWKNRVNLEDSVFAGYLVDYLKESHTWESDAVELVHLAATTAMNDLEAFLYNASHAKRFRRLGNHEDLKRCCAIDAYPSLMRYENDLLVPFDN